MGNFVPNVAKGKINSYHDRVNDNDPGTATIVIVAIDTSTADSVLEDLDDLAAILADAGTAEVTNAGYNRIVLSDTDIVASTVDDTANKRASDLPDQTFPSIVAGDSWTDLVICYDPAGGADNTLIPLSVLDFVRVPDGNDIVVIWNTLGYVEAE